MRIVRGYLAGALAAIGWPAAGLAQLPGEEAVVFTAQSGETADAYRGFFEVPENRNDPASRTIALGYVRFPATTDNPGSPIVYLAGGPGGSGTGAPEERRFPLFMAMRQHGDVIAFDQRGTGLSDDTPACRSSHVVPDLQPVGDSGLADIYRAAIRECVAFWRAEGADPAGYTTAESVQDISALRAHLGAERVALWGISYGSHLALAALDAIPGEIERAVITGAEGLDQTVKYPARTDDYIRRLQQAVNTQREARALYPDIESMIRRVQARLEAEPLLVTYTRRDGSEAEILFQRRHAQEVVSRLISDPQWATLMLAIYRGLDTGDLSPLQAALPFFHRPGEPLGFRLMPTAMDRASGISAGRLAEVRRQIPHAMVGGYLNFPMPQVIDVLEEIDLGPAFRDGPHGDTPVLLLSGTLDGRTYPDGQAEAVAGLGNVTRIMVRNAGHNLFMSSPEVGEVIHRFMRDEPLGTGEIEVALPDFTQLPF